MAERIRREAVDISDKIRNIEESIITTGNKESIGNQTINHNIEGIKDDFLRF